MSAKKLTQEIPPFEDLLGAMQTLCQEQQGESAQLAYSKNYRKNALEHYRREVGGSRISICVVCGFGIPSILEVAHLDQDRSNSALSNLAVLCPNCHKMHDIGLMPTEVVKRLRDEHLKENWGLRVKDAGVKAAATRKASATKKTRSAAAKKAWVSRGSQSKGSE